MAKGRNGGSDTLSAESIGFGSGMKGGDGGGFALNQASADMGNRFAQDQGGGGLLGGFFNPGRMIGSGIGSLVAGPIGGILGGLIGGGIGRNRQQGGWGYTDAEGNRVSAFRDMFDGGGRGRFGDTFEGGLLSNVANNMGIRPAGYRARQAGMGQQQPDYVGGMAAPATGGIVPATGGASPMAAPADVAPQPMGMTTPPMLTAMDVARLSEMGMNPGMAGEPASFADLAALIRGPGMLPGGMGVPVSRQYAPQNPGARLNADGMAFPAYGVPAGAGVNVGRPDVGTIRPPMSAMNMGLFNYGLLGR